MKNNIVKNTIVLLLMVVAMYFILSVVVPDICSDMLVSSSGKVTEYSDDQMNEVAQLVKNAVDNNEYGWCDTPYGKVYILDDGHLAKGKTGIMAEEKTEVYSDGKADTKDIVEYYYFDKDTGLLKPFHVSFSLHRRTYEFYDNEGKMDASASSSSRDINRLVISAFVWFTAFYLIYLFITISDFFSVEEILEKLCGYFLVVIVLECLVCLYPITLSLCSLFI